MFLNRLETLRQGDAGLLAQQQHIMAIDITSRVSLMAANCPLSRLAPHRSPGDQTVSGECFGRKSIAIHDGSVVQGSVREQLVEVQVDPRSNAVVQDVVPRPVPGPREDSVDASLRERNEQRVKMCGRRPYIKVGMSRPITNRTLRDYAEPSDSIALAKAAGVVTVTDANNAEMRPWV
ncbi:hypothetical protein ABZY42_18540 [Streptomyces sp. NPDC006622]|uniref:hypothetical protein n=1 Tax=Streptomyces sp. NPDC006622 TaxID=3155459 RepID=UPI0033A9FA1B